MRRVDRAGAPRPGSTHGLRGAGTETGNRVARAAVRKQANRKQRGTGGPKGARPGAKRARAKVTAGKRQSARATTVSAAAKRATTASAARKRATTASAARRRATTASAARRRATTASIRPKRATAPGVTRGRAKSRPARATVAMGAVRARRDRPAARSAAARATARRQVPQAFAAQRAGASPRELLLFEMARARASVRAAVQGLTSGSAERPIAPGKWSTKEIVLHLAERDRVRLEEFARTLGGRARSWAGVEDPEMAAVNEAHIAPLRSHGWDEALRRLDQLREQLLARLAQVPAEPDDPWRPGHPFADMMWGLPEHDRHHARQIKLARIGAAGPVKE